MDTISVALGKVLQVKNRLAGRLARTEQDIYRYNSTLEEQHGKVNIRKLLKLRAEIKAALLELKNVLYKSNAEIQSKLYELAEKKSDIEFFQSINTRDGKERHDYQNTDVVYKATVTKDEVDESVRRLEAEVDKLQDDINIYNYSTKIQLSKAVLDLAS